MQKKFRLYRRGNGTYYAEHRETGARTSLGTKIKAEAGDLIQAKNEAFVQPVFNREMAKVYLRAQDPKFCSRTWQDVADIVDAAYSNAELKVTNSNGNLCSAALRNLASGRQVGSSQVTSVVENRVQQECGRAYLVAMRLELRAPYFVKLTHPVALKK